jgi:hypothetical protein
MFLLLLYTILVFLSVALELFYFLFIYFSHDVICESLIYNSDQIIALPLETGLINIFKFYEKLGINYFQVKIDCTLGFFWFCLHNKKNKVYFYLLLDVVCVF